MAPVDSVDGQDSIAAHVAVPVLQAGPDGWHEGLQQLRLFQFAEETQGGATDELVGMLQILRGEIGSGFIKLNRLGNRLV